jgi:hypothetical protein
VLGKVILVGQPLLVVGSGCGKPVASLFTTGSTQAKTISRAKALAPPDGKIRKAAPWGKVLLTDCRHIAMSLSCVAATVAQGVAGVQASIV